MRILADLEDADQGANGSVTGLVRVDVAGLVQAPRHRFAGDLASGALIEVLAEFSPTPTQLSVLYPSNRQLPPRVRVVIDWLFQPIVPRLGDEQKA